MNLQNEVSSALYIIQRGQVRLTFDAHILGSPNVGSLKSDNQKEDNNPISGKMLSLVKTEGSYFGEWALLGEHIGSLSAIAVGDCTCSILTKEKFDSVVGPLTKLSQDVEKYVNISIKCFVVYFAFQTFLWVKVELFVCLIIPFV